MPTPRWLFSMSILCAPPIVNGIITGITWHVAAPALRPVGYSTQWCLCLCVCSLTPPTVLNWHQPKFNGRHTKHNLPLPHQLFLIGFNCGCQVSKDSLDCHGMVSITMEGNVAWQETTMGQTITNLGSETTNVLQSHFTAPVQTHWYHIHSFSSKPVKTCW